MSSKVRLPVQDSSLPFACSPSYLAIKNTLYSNPRFVTRESIQEYVDLDNLMVKFGGNDPWNYDYETENERMLQEVGSAV